MQPTAKQLEIIQDPAEQIIAAMARKTGKEQLAIWRAERCPGRSLILVPEDRDIKELAGKFGAHWTMYRSGFGQMALERGRQEIVIMTYSHLVGQGDRIRGSRYRQVIMLESPLANGLVVEMAYKATSMFNPESVLLIATPPENPDEHEFFTRVWNEDAWSKHTYTMDDHPMFEADQVRRIRAVQSESWVDANVDAKVPETVMTAS